jgi:hypothetical protein
MPDMEKISTMGGSIEKAWWIQAFNEEDRNPSMIELSQIDWAKLAAFIDGEGCISINIRNREANYRQHIATVDINNTDIRLMNWIQTRFGGRVRVNTDRGGNHRPLYKWQVSGGQVDRILKGCLEHFVLKREQAEVLLALRQTFARKRNFEPVTQQTIDTRDALKGRIHVLNHRGRAVA